MPDNFYRRRSIRLQGYDYTESGAYHVTICTHNRAWLFGEIINDSMVLNEFGETVRIEWLRTADLRPNVTLDAFVVMPNHVHGIVVIVDDTVGARRAVPLQDRTESFSKPVVGSLPTIIRSFKSAVTKQINILRDTPNARVWQKNYYEQIIRNETMLNAKRQYIEANPVNWAHDQENIS